jgi:hypothetical protein
MSERYTPLIEKLKRVMARRAGANLTSDESSAINQAIEVLRAAQSAPPTPGESELRKAAQRFTDAYEADLWNSLNEGLAPIMGMEGPSEEEGERCESEKYAAFCELRDLLAQAGGDPPPTTTAEKE